MSNRIEELKNIHYRLVELIKAKDWNMCELEINEHIKMKDINALKIVLITIRDINPLREIHDKAQEAFDIELDNYVL